MQEKVEAIKVYIATRGLFFEQTDYEIIVRSRDGKPVSLWHENYSVRDRISLVTDSDDLISGIVNFGNSAGFSEFEIFHDGKKSLVVRIEVFPSKIFYKEDYQDMLQDISNEIAGAVLDFMRNTYREFSIGSTQNTVRYYGEVTYMQKVKRKDIDFPMSRNNGDELYYAFRIKEWKTLSTPIAVKDEWVNEPKFTSLFLLEHCQQSFELFNIHSEEEYRLMVEINKAFDNLSTATTDNNSTVYRINDTHAVIVADGNFTITNNNGDILGSISISNFARSPRAGFNKVKGLIS